MAARSCHFKNGDMIADLGALVATTRRQGAPGG
jgi:hypothetical protein